jgi:hypothetical protein
MNTDVIEGNKLIAEFMGGELQDVFCGNIKQKPRFYFSNDRKSPLCGGRHSEDGDTLQYHTSFDWLMPVIEKIESIEMPEHRNDYNHIVKKGVLANISIHRVREVSKKEDGYYCTIQLWDYDALRFEVISKKSRIDATYLCVIKFIKWYNTIKQ